MQYVFEVSENSSVNDADKIRDQWQLYQLVEIPKDWHVKETPNAEKERNHHQSYWKNLERNWLDILPKENETKSVRIDSYWSQVFEMKNSDGSLKFPQLSALIKSVLTISHGNAGPEQGFSINKYILDVHSTNIGEDLLIALRRVKHRLLQVGGVTKFEITPSLLEHVKQSSSRFHGELKTKERKQNKEKEIDIQENNELSNIEDEIKIKEKGIEVAEQAISDGSKKLEQHLAVKKLNTAVLQKDNELIQMGMQRKRKLSDELANLMKKKNAILKFNK